MARSILLPSYSGSSRATAGIDIWRGVARSGRNSEIDSNTGKDREPSIARRRKRLDTTIVRQSRSCYRRSLTAYRFTSQLYTIIIITVQPYQNLSSRVQVHLIDCLHLRYTGTLETSLFPQPAKRLLNGTRENIFCWTVEKLCTYWILELVLWIF